MDAIVVRKATLKDIDILLQFEQGIIEAERQFDDTLKSSQINYYNLQEMILDANSEVAVAELDNNVVASGYARIENAMPRYNFEKFALIGFLYVIPEHRGKAVISKIVEYLKNWCIEKNINELMLEVYYENLQAIKAYEKIGFIKNVIQMRMPVNKNDNSFLNNLNG